MVSAQRSLRNPSHWGTDVPQTSAQDCIAPALDLPTLVAATYAPILKCIRIIRRTSRRYEPRDILPSASHENAGNHSYRRFSRDRGTRTNHQSL